ncbi:MAG: glycosyltransferase [Clostridia bacterium]|nr:glycosyltransferase [Clostridia bacterium]
MKYLWFGFCADSVLRESITKNGGKMLSANVSQDSIVAGLAENGVVCDSINSMAVSAYPKYKECFIKKYFWTDGNNEHTRVGYFNIKYLNLLSKKYSLKKAAAKWARKNKKEEVTVFIYSMHLPLMAAASIVKKIIPAAKIILIVPDLPQYMDMHMSRLKKILKSYDWQCIKSTMKYIDKYVLYSKHMADFLKLSKEQYIVMEGSFDPSLIIEDEPKKDTDKLSVMYSGVIDLRYGIKELLDAISLLDDKYELWFTGSGNAVPLIQEKASKDSRIKYYGYFPSRLDLLRKQKEATMLISPRSTQEVASKYCFPSKIFEYMVSGNPVISTRIGGIPDEYFEYLIPIENTSPDQIAAAIKKVGEMSPDERKSLGCGGKKFILENKNNVAQAKRIIEFV